MGSGPSLPTPSASTTRPTPCSRPTGGRPSGRPPARITRTPTPTRTCDGGKDGDQGSRTGQGPANENEREASDATDSTSSTNWTTRVPRRLGGDGCRVCDGQGGIRRRRTGGRQGGRRVRNVRPAVL